MWFYSRTLIRGGLFPSVSSENLIKRLGAAGLLNYTTLIYTVDIVDGGSDCVRKIS